MSMDAFDQQVAELRAKGVEPKCFSSVKAKATPVEWASHLEYRKLRLVPEKMKEACRKWYWANRERSQTASRRWKAANADRNKATRSEYLVAKKYHLLPAQYDAMHAGQGGVCAICSGECSTGKRLAVDHNHENGAVRGLLCASCNLCLGRMQDSPDLLRKAADYLEQGGTQAFCLKTFYTRAMETTNARN
jgi:hypothetical protein